MQSLALTIAVFIPDPQLNSIVATIVSQLLLLVNGFYTQLPTVIQWTSYLSPPRYTFQALMKLEFSWRDSFYVHPNTGWASHGFPQTWLPAEVTTTFEDMRRRGLNVMQSPHEPSLFLELSVLLSTFLIGRLLLLFACIRVLREESLAVEQEGTSCWQKFENSLHRKATCTEDNVDDIRQTLEAVVCNNAQQAKANGIMSPVREAELSDIPSQGDDPPPSKPVTSIGVIPMGRSMDDVDLDDEVPPNAIRELDCSTNSDWNQAISTQQTLRLPRLLSAVRPNLLG